MMVLGVRKHFLSITGEFESNYFEGWLITQQIEVLGCQIEDVLMTASEKKHILPNVRYIFLIFELNLRVLGGFGGCCGVGHGFLC